MRIDLANAQGNLLRGYTHPVARFIYLHVVDADRARAWLVSVVDEVTTAAPWSEKPSSTFNLSFTFAGLRALRLPKVSLEGFPDEFQAGMAAQADALGDRGPCAPGHWEAAFHGSRLHVLVALYALDGAALEARETWLNETIARAGGLERIDVQDATRLEHGVEHFGFADGAGQPDIAGSEVETVRGRGALQPDGSWRPLATGEFLLGYPDEEGVLPDAPRPSDLARDATYLVYRKLAQDVALFRAYTEQHGYTYPGGAAAVASRIVGRWPDGTPLSLSPHAPDEDLASDVDRSDDFTFGSDRRGFRCPIGSHIRRANPRDALPSGPKLVNRHRMVRRSIAFGPPFGDDPAVNAKERGILFVCFQASIARQFAFVQSQWLNDGNIFGLGRDRDPLAGYHDGTGKMTIQGVPPRFLPNIPLFVTTRGGAYLFQPGISGLRYIASPGTVGQ